MATNNPSDASTISNLAMSNNNSSMSPSSALTTPTGIAPSLLANKQLNSSTLSRALTKPPPLSALINTGTKSNGSLSTANSSLSPSPSILQQQQQTNTTQNLLTQQPLIGSNLIAQSKKSTELLNQTQNGSNNSLNSSISNSSQLNSSLGALNSSLPPPISLPPLSQVNFSNSMPASSTAMLFNNIKPTNTNIDNTKQQFYTSQPLSAPISNLNQNQTINNHQHQQQPTLDHNTTTTPTTQSLFSNTTNTPLTAPASSFPTSASLFNQPQIQQSTQPNTSFNANTTPFLNKIENTPFTNTNYQNTNGPLPNLQNISQIHPPFQSQLQAHPQQTSQSQLLSTVNNNNNQLYNPASSSSNANTNNLISNYPTVPNSTSPFNSQIGAPPLLNNGYQTNQTMPPVGPPPINNFNKPVIGPPPAGPPISQPPTGPMMSQPPAGSMMSQPPPLGPPPQTGFVPSLNNQPKIGPPPISGQQYQPPLPQQQLTQPPTQPPPIRPPAYAPPNTSFPTQQIQPPPTTSQTGANARPNTTNQQTLQNQFNNMSLSSSQQQSNNTQGLNSNNFNNNNNNNNSANRSQPNAIDLLREKKLIVPYNEDVNDPPRPMFPHEFYTNVNCHADTIRCTLTSIPESQNLLHKCRLPLGILIHPFKDLESLKVVQSSTIVRCRNCRSYINPFVHFLDNSKWRCNMCYSINDLPEEFLFDPVTRSYGDPSKRPEINSSTIEFIAPPEYTLRPPPPAMYLYLLDVSHNAINTGYLHNFCETLAENLDKIPGDSRAQIGFITYNSSIHFYNLSDSLSQPKMMIFPDLDEIILPMPDGLMVSLNENRESLQSFLQSLPGLFADTYETDSALGTALNSAYQLLKHTGGRITIMQTCLPNLGVGNLKQREENIDKDSNNLAPQTDFYKKLALDCAGVQIAVDLFMFNSLNADIATLSCVSKYSGGEIKYYPGFHPEHHPEQVIRFCADFKRYITRKIGFEAVMRIRCTRGLAIHTFHGNFFVRSTDLLALPNVNPDAGFGMQVNIEESLTDITTVCFQAAVLYTSSKSERRIRIHTYCLPVTKNINELVNGADQEAIIGLISKMAVDRTAMSSLKEARDAMINVAIDYLQAYSQHITSHRTGSLISPNSLRLVPLLVLSLMKNTAFKFGSVKMDDRVYAMNLCKTMPLKYLMLTIYPHLYAVHNLDDKKVITDSYDTEIFVPPRVHLSSENIDRHGIYLMDCGESIYMWVGRSVSDLYLQQVFDCRSFAELPDHLTELPELENELSEKIKNFLAYLFDSRPFGITFLCFKEGSHFSSLFFQHMHDDKTENSISYYEFLRHLNDQISN